MVLITELYACSTGWVKLNGATLLFPNIWKNHQR